MCIPMTYFLQYLLFIWNSDIRNHSHICISFLQCIHWNIKSKNCSFSSPITIQRTRLEGENSEDERRGAIEGAQWGIRGGSAKMNLFHKPLIMSNKTWPLKNLFLREVSKFFKCYVLVKSFARKPVLSLKTLKIGFFNTLL